jgi:hypothetical protein
MSSAPLKENMVYMSLLIFLDNRLAMIKFEGLALISVRRVYIHATLP